MLTELNYKTASTPEDNKALETFYKNKHNIDIIHKATPVCLQVINIIMEQWN